MAVVNRRLRPELNVFKVERAAYPMEMTDILLGPMLSYKATDALSETSYTKNHYHRFPPNT